MTYDQKPRPVPLACEACGARLSVEAQTCDLCGVPVGEVEAKPTMPDESETVSPLEEGTVPPTAEALSNATWEGIFCNACGWRNPPDARFCSQCGARLQAVPSVSSLDVSSTTSPPVRSVPSAVEAEEEHASTPRGMERQMGIVIGSGVLLVVALYLVTVVSSGAKRGGADTPAASQTVEAIPPSVPVPLSPQIEQQAEAFKAEIATLQGEARLAKQRELVNLYVGIGRYDLAAAEQERIAETEDTEQHWTQVGNLYYDWMDTRAGPERGVFAKKAIVGYQRALEHNPDNLNVRTDMAIAYMHDPDNPMQAIQQTNIVLEKDPNHIQANFNRGIMLMQVNRLDQALAQFEKVKQIVGDANNPIYQRTEGIIQSLREAQGNIGF